MFSISLQSTLPDPSIDARADLPYLGRLRINTSWFLKLRWIAVSGQVLTIACTHVILGAELPMAALLTIVGIAAASNVVLELWFHRTIGSPVEWLAKEGSLVRGRGELVLGGVMVLDVVLLTALLYVSGGPTNPFAIFYLANLSLAAVILGARWVWSLSALVVICYVGLHLFHRPLTSLGDLTSDRAGLLRSALEGRDPLVLHLAGKLIAFTAAVGISIYFMTRVTSELARREVDLQQARDHQVQSERLESLATLAAGAAHELASPLSTIAVIAKDLEVDLEERHGQGSVVEDARLMRREVDRCRTILDAMAAGAGESAGEALVSVSLGELVDDSLDGLIEAERVRVRFVDRAREERLFVPREALVRATRSLIKNALDASTSDARVEVQARSDATGHRIEISDRGSGMSSEVLARAGEPFFTTKEPGSGMGMGIFLTRKLLARLGGTLEIRSEEGSGTVAEVRLPRGAGRLVD